MRGIARTETAEHTGAEGATSRVQMAERCFGCHCGIPSSNVQRFCRRSGHWEDLLLEPLRQPFDIHAAALAAAISLIQSSLDNDERWPLGGFSDSTPGQVPLRNGLKFFWGPEWLFLGLAFKGNRGWMDNSPVSPMSS